MSAVSIAAVVAILLVVAGFVVTVGVLTKPRAMRSPDTRESGRG